MGAIVILREAEPPLEALGDVLTASAREGDPTVQRMVRAWKDSFAPTVSGRPGRGGLFNNPGEGLYVAWDRATAVGLCGLRLASTGAGRLEPVYVLPDYRRRHLGAEMVARAIQHGGKRVKRVAVYARLPAGRAFFDAQGFARRPAGGRVTHELLVDPDGA
jgi:GNAT superfamily N-acetyltransferase